MLILIKKYLWTLLRDAWMNIRPILLWVFVGIILITHLSNIWRFRTYPFTDLPNHLAEAYLVRTLTLNSNDPLAEYYRIAITPYTPASLHAIFCALFQDIEFGNKIYYSLYYLILFASMVFLIYSAGGNSWLAILTTLFFYNFSARWGFAPYTAGIALVLLSMLLLIKYLDHPTIWRAIWLGLVCLAVYYAHAITWLFAVACVGIILISRRGLSIKQRILGLSVLLPSFLIFVNWQLRAQGFSDYIKTLPFLVNYYKTEYLGSIPQRIVEFFLVDNRSLASGWLGVGLALGFSLPLVVGLAILVVQQRASFFGSLDIPARYCGMVFLLVAGVCYLVLPNRLPDQHFIYERICVFVFMGIIWVIGYSISKNFHTLLRLMIVLVVFVHTGLWLQYFHGFAALSRPFEAMLYHSAVAKERSMASMIVLTNYRGQSALTHFQNYQIVWNHGPVTTGMVIPRFPLVRLSHEGAFPLKIEELEKKKRFEKALRLYRKIDLLLCDTEIIKIKLEEQGGYRVVSQVDQWYLLKK